MNISFYKTASHRNSVEEFILHIAKEDQARLFDVYKSFKEHGLACQQDIVFT